MGIATQTHEGIRVHSNGLNFHGASSTHLHMTAGGLIAIGNTSPAYRLDITNTGSESANIAIRNTGNGDAGIWFDGSNGDLVGGDYAFLGQKNSLVFEMRTSGNAGNIHLNPRDGAGAVDINGDLVVSGTLTAQEFSTEFINQTIIQEDGDVQVDGDIFLAGTATTTNQGYGIHWTGFDKEGTTDFSDAAFIKHTTSSGGHSGSVLLISSQNDANDGIGFLTNASSQLKHNGNTIWTAGNDGSGSGLDADLWDGNQFNSYLNQSVKTDAQPLFGAGSAASYIRIGDSVADNNTGGWNKGVQLNATAHGRFRIRTTNHTHGTIETYYWADSSVSPSIGIYGNKSDFKFTGSIVNLKNSANNTFWHSGNDGSGSGLDADLLDGIDSTSFIRSDANDTFTADYLGFSSLSLGIANNNSDNGFNTYFRGNSTHFVLGLTNGNTLYLNYGNSSGALRLYGTVWHNDVNIGTPWGSSNDGSGSGLDADTVDGLQASSFIRSDAADSVSGEITFNAGITGFDSASEITGTNFNIRGVNEIFINDPGEGIVWQNGSSGNMQLAITDDSTDRILNLSGTGASLAVNGAKVATESWVTGQISSSSGISQSTADGRYWLRGGSWAADLVTTHGYIRQVGYNAAGGEFVLASINNKMTGLLDGDYLAGERGGFYSMDNNNTFASRRGFYNDGSYAKFNTPINMGGNHIHYVNEVHFSGNVRFKDSGNNNYIKLQTGSTSHGGFQLTTNGSTRGYLYFNSSDEVGLLDSGGSWAIRHTNDSGTDFFTDGETKEFSIGRDKVTGNYGTVQTHTTEEGWGGYSINGQYVFMSDHGSNVGIYNDIDNEWMTIWRRNAGTELHFNGSEKLRTTNTGIQVTGHIVSSSKTTYSKGYGSLDATGQAVAGLVTGYNGNSAMITFTCYGSTGQYQKIVYSCWNTSGTSWNVRKVVDEGTNEFDIEVDALAATRTFTFTGRGGNRSYSPTVIIEFSGAGFNSSYL